MAGLNQLPGHAQSSNPVQPPGRALRLDGKLVSESVREKLQHRVAAFLQRYHRPPQLAVILVGDDKASEIYVRNKHLACAKVGMKSMVLNFPASLSEENLIAEIQRLNLQNDIDGILVQMPLPRSINTMAALEAIDPHKDADGLTSYQLGQLFMGTTQVTPCTPAGVMEILKHYNIELSGRHAVVIGRSQIVGKPMAQLLLAADMTVTMAHSKSRNLFELTKVADLVVVAAGKAGLVPPTAFKKGAVVIDVGIHRVGPEGKQIVGDVQMEKDGVNMQDIAAAITPVPGGVGPMTITMLLQNTVKLAEIRAARGL